MKVLLFVIGFLILVGTLLSSFLGPISREPSLPELLWKILKHIDYLIGCILIATASIIMAIQDKRNITQKEVDEEDKMTFESKMNIGIAILFFVIFAVCIAFGFYKYS